METKVKETPLIRDWSKATEEEVEEGYREMAADDELEREAYEWVESSPGECL